MGYTVNIRDRETDEVVRSIGQGMSMRQAARVEDGANINLNHDKFYTSVDEPDEIFVFRNEKGEMK